LPWNLDRIDQEGAFPDKSFRWPGGQECTADGAGVHIYVLDTGVHGTHEEFEGRASGYHYDATRACGSSRTASECVVDVPEDHNGHGTAVAGVAAGAVYGVAKGAQVHSVKVLNDNQEGSTANVLKGLHWVVSDLSVPNHKKVVVLSLGQPLQTCGTSQCDWVEDKIQTMVNSGILVTIAAGNYMAEDAHDRDSCQFSPGRIGSGPDGIDGVITVSSSAFMDTEPLSTNAGECSDLYAPGGSEAKPILSAGNSGNTSAAFHYGTSMAAPMAAGVAALVLSVANLSPATTENFIKGSAVYFNSTDTDSPDKLLNINLWVTPPSDAPDTPTPISPGGPPTCAGRCGLSGYQSGSEDPTCYCDAACVRFHDCCDDACLQCNEVRDAPWKRPDDLKCDRSTCETKWTFWRNEDTPEGAGDLETVNRLFGTEAQWEGTGVHSFDRPCAWTFGTNTAWYVKDVECRTSDTGTPWNETQPDKYICTRGTGGRCKHAWGDDDGEDCLDYEVRFLCDTCPHDRR